jgi:hypothetical protein
MYLLIGAKRRGTYEEERSAYIPSRDAKAAHARAWQQELTLTCSVVSAIVEYLR